MLLSSLPKSHVNESGFGIRLFTRDPELYSP
jgi:hypothetical protein